MEEILNVEIVVPQLEYITHEEYTMSMEREANRKLKAEIRRKKKAKGRGIKWQMDNQPMQYYAKRDLTIEKAKEFVDNFVW
jgi:hypothetical protein